MAEKGVPDKTGIIVMIKNWKVICNLASPLCGGAPKIDSLLEYELALRLWMKQSKKVTRNIPLLEIEKPPIPLAKRTINGHDIYCSSDPILGVLRAEWTEHQSKRFDIAYKPPHGNR